VEGGNVEALEGTMITVHARTNQPAKSGELYFTKAEADRAAMTVSTADPHELTGRFVVRRSGTYYIKFRNTGDKPNPDPVVYDIIALPDKPPTAQIVHPDQPVLKVPRNVVVPFQVTASDDHGVKDVTLHATLGNESLLSLNLLENKPPTTQ